MSIHLESSSFSKPLVTPPEEFFCQLHEFLSVFLESVQDAGELSYERLIQNCLSCDHAGIKILIPFPKTLLDRSPHPIDINQAFLDIKELYKRHQSTFVKEFQTSFEETFSNLSTPIEKIESFLACINELTTEMTLKKVVESLKALTFIAKALDERKDRIETLYPLLRLIEERSRPLVHEKIHPIERLFFHLENMHAKEDGIHTRMIKSLEQTIEDLLYLKTVEEIVTVESAIVRFQNPSKKPAPKLGLSLFVLCDAMGAQEDLSEVETKAFHHLGAFIPEYGVKRISDLALDVILDHDSWQKNFRDLVVLSHHQALPIALSQKEIRWITGTSSHTVVGMYASQLRGFTKDLALIPSGRLLNQNLVPLSGELGFGILSSKGVNQHHLSGCDSMAYMHAFNYAFSSEFYFDPTEIKSQIKELFDHLPASFGEKEDIASLNRIKIPLLRALDYVQLTPEELSLIRQKLSAWLESEVIHPAKKAEVVAFFSFAFEDRSPIAFPALINDLLKRGSFPLAFASTTLKEEEMMAIRSSVTGERLYRGIMPLSDKINLAITVDEEVELLKQVLPIPVISFKTAEFLLKA